MAHIDWTTVLAARGIELPGYRDALEARIEATRLREEAEEQARQEKARAAQEKLARSAHKPRYRVARQESPG